MSEITETTNAIRKPVIEEEQHSSPIVIININNEISIDNKEEERIEPSNAIINMAKVGDFLEVELHTVLSEKKNDDDDEEKVDQTIIDIQKVDNEFNEPYYCQICMNTYPVNDSSFNPYKLSCGHIYCTECLYQFLYSKITDGEVNPKCFIKVESQTNSSNFATSLSRHVSAGLQPHPPEDISGMLDLKENSDFSNSDSNSNSAITQNIKRSGSHNIDPTQEADHAQQDTKLQRMGSSNSGRSQRSGIMISSSLDSLPNPSLEQLLIHEINVQTGPKDCGQPISDTDIIELIKTDKNLMDKWQRFSFFHKNINGRECPNILCRELLSFGTAESPNMTCPK